jgi:hypothetical protein
MRAFERVTQLEPGDYYIEAKPGGAAAWTEPTRLTRFVYRTDGIVMGWAGHGDRCLGFRGDSDVELRRRLERTARRRAGEFSRALHVVLFAVGGEVEVVMLDAAR